MINGKYTRPQRNHREGDESFGRIRFVTLNEYSTAILEAVWPLGAKPHRFWSWMKIQPLWDGIHSVLGEVLGYKIPRSCLILYLGHVEETVHVGDQHLVKIILAAWLKAIIKNCLKTGAWDYKQWLTIIDIVMENSTYRLKMKGEDFAKGWANG